MTGIGMRGRLRLCGLFLVVFAGVGGGLLVPASMLHFEYWHFAVEDRTEVSARNDRVLDAVFAELGVDLASCTSRLRGHPRELWLEWERCAFWWIEYELVLDLSAEHVLVRPSLLEPLDRALQEIGSRVAEVSERYDHENGMRVLSAVIVSDLSTGQRSVSVVTHRLLIRQRGVLPPSWATGASGRMALVVDDVGYRRPGVGEFARLGVPLTFAVLPFERYTEAEARLAYETGHSVILHLPMEPRNPAVDMGPGGLRVEMEEEEMLARLRAALEEVPSAEGVNNHMGSRMTAEPSAMKPVLSALGEMGLFFLDSLTTPASVVREVARDIGGVRVATNELFLDNERDVEYIKSRTRELASRALSMGYAIGIGLDWTETLQALSEILPELECAGIEFVYVRELVQSERETVPPGIGL